MSKVPSIRSAFMAPPGHAIVESDYKSAEIYAFGYLSNCMKLVSDAKSDLHARGAVTRMGAPKWNGYDEKKKPPDSWKKDYEHLRVASKAVIFGIFYQRGPASIAREVLDTTHGKIECTKQQAQGMIDAFYNDYPEGKAYVDLCKKCVVDPGYVSNAYGRRRRFYVKEDEPDHSFLAACERESVNMPIQGTVGDTLNVALYNFYLWKRRGVSKCQFKLLLPFHDAVMAEVPFEHVEEYVDTVVPLCMTEAAMIPRWKQAPWETKTFKLETDTEVSLRWKVKNTPEDLLSAGMSEKLAKRFGHGK